MKNYTKNLKAIIFDADGVMINSEMFSIQYQEKFGINNDEMLPFFKGIFQECLVGKGDLKKIIIPYLKKWKWKKSVDELLEFWFKAEHKISQQLVDLIEKIKEQDVKCYLATNNEKYRLGYMKNEMGFDSLFDKIYSSAELGCKKPEQEFFRIMYDDIKRSTAINKDEILFLDDELEHVEKAKEFGFQIYLYKKFEDFKKYLKIIKLINHSNSLNS